MSDCTTTRRWLETRGTGLPADLTQAAQATAHLARCPTCTALQASYAAFQVDCRDLLLHTPAPGAEARFIEHATQASALRKALRHTPSPGAEARFLAAAREQQAPPRRPWRALVALAAAAAVAVGVSAALWEAPEIAPVAPEASLKVTQQIGTAHADGAVLVAEASVQDGAIIETDADAVLSLGIPGDAWITLSGRSRLLVDAWHPGATRLTLEAGTLQAGVAHREEGQSFEVQTADARVIVVGTVFSVQRAQDRTVVSTTEGRVRVERPDGTLVGHVSAGEQLLIEPPAPPAPAPEPPPAHEPQPPLPVVEPLAPDPIQEARQRLADGDVTAAMVLLQAAPGGWERDALLGDAHQLQGQHPAARDAYVRALSQIDPPPPALLVDLARLQQGPLSDPAGAAETWGRYLSRAPEGSEAHRAHLAIGRHLQGTADGAGAAVHFRALLASPPSPEREAALVLLGGAHIRGQRWDEARALFEAHAGEQGAMGETATVGLIRVHIAQGDRDATAARIAEYHQRFPEGRRQQEVARMAAALKQ